MRWTGAFYFGELWAAYRGPAGDNAPHAHAACQVTLGMQCDVALTNATGRRIAGRALIAPAGVAHRLEPAEDVIVVLCDPTSTVAAAVKSSCPADDIAELPVAMSARFQGEGPLSNLLDDFGASPMRIDPRLEKALAFLDADPGHRIEAAARHCGLSTARLRSIAAAQLGVPLSRWQNWRMLRRAGLALSAGASLADAAQAAGFADQAHFSRTMKAMTGLTPSSAREPLALASDRFKTG